LPPGNEEQQARAEDAPEPVRSRSEPLPPIQLSLPGFEGPLELLLRLTERDQFDITSISLVDVTAQYLERFRAQPWADAVALGDFVAIGARLLLLKSRSLLPRPPTEVESEPESDEAELLRALAEYRGYREAAAMFSERAALGRLFPRAAPAPEPAEPALQKIPLNNLILALQDALARFPEPEPSVALPVAVVSIGERIKEIRVWLLRDSRVGFRSIVAQARSRLEVVVSFIAVLHLIRDQEIEADQTEPFGEIWLSARKAEADPADRAESGGI
jgi:segregation and condensation protein A